MIAGEREFAPARPPEVIVERGCSWVAPDKPGDDGLIGAGAAEFSPYSSTALTSRWERLSRV
jgi:hypothetical protein